MSKKKLKILQPMESNALRRAYLNAFLDQSSAHFLNYIATPANFSDGIHYVGYLWDCVKIGVQIPYDQWCREAVRFREVLVLADNHSRERVITAPLWPFPPNSVIGVTPKTLLQLLPALPEDLYVFDRSVLWTLILTHEHDGQRRICLAAGIEGWSLPVDDFSRGQMRE